jgi:N-formylglutamate deformylase
MTPAFHFQRPTAQEVPIILSIPHCGTAFPDELVDQYEPALSKAPDDTDWFVDKLYSFAPGMGITLLKAHYSRWVVDLNRDPESKPLYSDGRIITGLCPVTDFLGHSIYVDKRAEIEKSELERRIRLYYTPYHQQLQKLIDEKKEKFGVALLWDCHSIRQSVPTIHSEKFPDLILGDADETSAAPEIISEVFTRLTESSYHVSHNHPFKGGYITRHYGKPHQHIHTLQLEMSKVMYMNDDERDYHEKRASDMQQLLKKVFSALINKLATVA